MEKRLLLLLRGLSGKRAENQILSRFEDAQGWHWTLHSQFLFPVLPPSRVQQGHRWAPTQGKHQLIQIPMEASRPNACVLQVVKSFLLAIYLCWMGNLCKCFILEKCLGWLKRNADLPRAGGGWCSHQEWVGCPVGRKAPARQSFTQPELLHEMPLRRKEWKCVLCCAFLGGAGKARGARRMQVTCLQGWVLPDLWGDLCWPFPRQERAVC